MEHGVHGRGVGLHGDVCAGDGDRAGLPRGGGPRSCHLDVGKRVYVAVDRDRDRAGRRLAEYFAAFYGRAELAAEVSVWGSADQCVAGLREITAAGARLLMLNPVFDELEQLEILAAEVVPRL